MCLRISWLPRLALLLLAGAGQHASAAPGATPGRVQVRCVALRVPTPDMDALGINFDLQASDKNADAPGLRYAAYATGSPADTMLRLLTGKPRSGQGAGPFVSTVTVTDGQSGVLSLGKMTDPGLTTQSRLMVLPAVQADGTIALSVNPQLQFVRPYRLDGQEASDSAAGFPLRRTLADGSTLAFTEELVLPRKLNPHDRFASRSVDHLVGITSSQLWIFLTATLLPQAPPLVVPAAVKPARLLYFIGRVRIADADPTEFVWEVRGQEDAKDVALRPPGDVFQSLAAPELRDWVSRLPPGTNLLSFFRIGAITSEKDLAFPPKLKAEVDDFSQFCKLKNVDWAYMISGG